MFMEVMGRYAPPIPEILADDTPGVTKTCVDLGCGSGSWYVRTLPAEDLCLTSLSLGYWMSREISHIAVRSQSI